MAIVKMEKLILTCKTAHLDKILRLMQDFQGIQIESGLAPTIPPEKRSDIDGEIGKIEKNLLDIQAAYGVLKERGSAKTFSFLKSQGEKRLTISELAALVEGRDWKKILEDIIHTHRRLHNNDNRRHEVSHQLESLNIWAPLGCSPLDFGRLHRASAFYGSVHELHAEEFSQNLGKYEEDGIGFEETLRQGDRVYFLLICHESMSDKLSLYMNEYSFSPVEYPFKKPQAEARRELENEAARLLEEEAEIGRLLEEHSQYEEILAFAEDYNLNDLIRHKKSLDIIYDGEENEIKGWIIAERRAQFEELLSKNVAAADYRALFLQVADKETDSVPIKLKNKKLVAVFERLTEMYSLPKYNELDPTPALSVFYFILFGLMVSDFGYGLSIFAVGLFIKKFLKLKRSTLGFVDFLYYLSFSIIGWGLVVGTGFGVNFGFGLLDVTVDIIQLTVLSIALGFVHIMAGLVMSMINDYRRKNYADLLTGGLSWFLAFLGGAMMLLAKATPWFDIAALFWSGAVLTGAGVAMVLFVPAVQYGKRWPAGIGKGLYALYGATGYLGDFISYTRLMALAIAGASVAMAFNIILGFLPLPFRLTFGVILAIALHCLNIALTLLSAYVHGIRLQFIEFFGKFYTGGGKKFEPFKAAEKNIVIVEPANDK